MSVGPGKYDAECTFVRESTQADAVVVMVFGGHKGDGFSIQGSIRHHLMMPAMLRYIADEIEKTHQQGQL